MLTQFDNYSRADIEHLIDQYIHNERNRAIFKRRILDGVLFEPLAEEFNLSVRQVQNIIYKCDKQLFGKIL